MTQLGRDRADDAEIRSRLYRFYSWCADTKIPEVHRLATTIETWWPAILAFLHTGLTNARTEGYNRLVKQVKRVLVNRPSGTRHAGTDRAPAGGVWRDRELRAGSCFEEELMGLRVVSGSTGHRIEGTADDIDVVNAFLNHLSVRNFSLATRRAYAFDLLNFLRFLAARSLRLSAVVPTDLFEYLDWQREPVPCSESAVVVNISSRTGAAPATMNRRVAAVRGCSSTR